MLMVGTSSPEAVGKHCKDVIVDSQSRPDGVNSQATLVCTMSRFNQARVHGARLAC